MRDRLQRRWGRRCQHCATRRTETARMLSQLADGRSVLPSAPTTAWALRACGVAGRRPDLVAWLQEPFSATMGRIFPFEYHHGRLQRSWRSLRGTTPTEDAEMLPDRVRRRLTREPPSPPLRSASSARAAWLCTAQSSTLTPHRC